MKLRLLLCFLAGVATALAIIFWPGDNKGSEEYNPENDKQLQEAIESSPRAAELRELLSTTPADELRDMAFLIANMPASDRDGMDLELLKENVSYAHKAHK